MMSSSDIRRHTVKAAIPVFSLVVACGAAGQLTFPAPRTATYAVMETVAIDTSNTNVGIADPYLYGMSAEDVNKTLDEIQALGVKDVRIVIFWAGVEPKDDVYDWDQIDLIVNAAAERNMGVVADLNSTPSWATVPGTPAISGPPADPAKFADFAADVAARYAGKIGAYEVWNEPNSKTFWSTGPDPAGYTELLKAAYPAIKTADPDAIVIGAVTAPLVSVGNLTMDPVTFLSGMYEAGAQGNFDALSFHPYHYTLPFSQGGSVANSPLSQLERMRELMVQYGDGAKLIWATEYGEPSSVAGNQGQAAFIADFLYAWANQSYTGPSFIFTTHDTGSFWSDKTLGILQPDGTPKAAAQFIEDWLDGIRPTEPPPVPTVGFVPRLALLVEQVLNVVKVVVPFAAAPVELLKTVLAPFLGAVVSVANNQSVATAVPDAEPTEIQTPSAAANFDVSPEPGLSRRSNEKAEPETTTSENKLSGANLKVATSDPPPEQPADETDATAPTKDEQDSGEAANVSSQAKPHRRHAKTEDAASKKPDSGGNKTTPFSRDTNVTLTSVSGADKTDAQGDQDDSPGSSASAEGAGGDDTGTP